jgi:hypothetical protein
MSDTASWPRRESECVVAVLVSQALDDIQAENIEASPSQRQATRPNDTNLED